MSLATETIKQLRFSYCLWVSLLLDHKLPALPMVPLGARLLCVRSPFCPGLRARKGAHYLRASIPWSNFPMRVTSSLTDVTGKFTTGQDDVNKQ